LQSDIAKPDASLQDLTQRPFELPSIPETRMSILVVRRPMRFPSFRAAKWRKHDHDIPLTLQLDQARAMIFLEEDTFSTKRSLIVFPRGRLELHYDPAPSDLLKGLTSRGTASGEVANTIYNAYADAYTRFEALLYSAGRVRYLLRMGLESITDFYSEGGWARGEVEWRVDNNPFVEFRPKLAKVRGRNPLFTSAQLVTPTRWRDMQECANNANEPGGEVLELFRIRGKVGWREIRNRGVYYF
jgi:hypothetical protein